jgi:hypothetical protein
MGVSLMKKQLAVVAVVGGALLTGSLPGAAQAHADAPQVGQSCDHPSQIMFRGTPNPPVLLCGPEVHRWVLWGGDGLSTTESEEVGAPCHVPFGYLAMAITPVDSPSALYLVTCNQGVWGAYRP